MPEVVATAGAVKIVITGDGSSFSTAVAEVNRQLDKLGVGAKSAGTTLKREMNEGRGAIMVLGEEIGVHLPRHVQKFVAELPGVARTMAAAFDAIAVFAIGAALVEAAKKVSEFVIKNREAARLNAEAWAESRDRLSESNDELELGNLKIENQIAKLEHKPQNKLAEALLEARIETEKLDDKLQAAIKDAGRLLEKSDSGWVALSLGQAGTHQEQVMNEEHGIHLREAGTPEEKLAESRRFTAALQSRLNELLGLQGSSNSRLPFTHPGGFNYGNEITAVRELLSRQGEEERGIIDQMLRSTDQGRLGKAEDRFAANGEAEKQAQIRLRGFETELAKQKQLWSMSVADEKAFWASKLSSFAVGSQQYLEVLAKFNTASAALSAQFAAVQKKAQPQNVPDDVSRADEVIDRLLGEQAEDVTHAGERWAQFNRELERGYQQFAQASVQLRELNTGFLETTGAISAHDAALERAAEHLAAYATERSVLEEQLSRIEGDTSLSKAQQSTQAAQVRNQISSLDYQRQAQGFQDAAQIRATTVMGALADAAARTEQAFLDLPTSFSRLFDETMTNLNSKIIQAISGQKGVNFSDVGRGLLQGVAGVGLRGAEGALLKALGVGGKKGDSASNPLWVAMASGAGGSSSAGGAVGGIFSSLAHLFIPGFASGGSISSNMPAIVGENGPELFMPSTSGRIIPNGQAFGGSPGVTINVDASHSGDPAATEAAVHRAMREYTRQVPSMAIAAVRDHNARSPKSGRL